MGAIYRGPKRGYVMTDDDVLWLARALGGEAGTDITETEAAWHFWCWMDRFHLWKYSDTHFKEFWDLIRHHSKAVNDDWMHPGEKRCADVPADCKPDKIKYREYWCSQSPAQLQKSGLWALAKKAQDGKLDRPTGEPILDFAACWLVAKQGRPCTGYAVGPKGEEQCFLSKTCLKKDELAAILDGDVRVEWGVEKIGWTAVGLLFATGVGWAIYTLIRR
jgi:hypothetical protein